MSSLISNGPARRLLCRTQSRWRELIAAEHSNYEELRSRPYATARISPKSARVQSASPSSSSGPAGRNGTPARESSPSIQPGRLIFSSNDVPPPKEWTLSLEGLGCVDSTASQCVDGASRYVKIATKDESQWRGDLEKKHNLSPYFLHWMGIALISANTPARWRLGTHMLRSASELGFMPSTLSLVSLFSSMPPSMFDKAQNTIMFRDANARFERSLASSTDPNAFTLRGKIYAKNGDEADAIDMFKRATKVWMKANHKAEASTDSPAASEPSSKAIRVLAAEPDHQSDVHVQNAAASSAYILPPPREPRWEWEIANVLGQAEILVKYPKKVKKAQELFEVAAVELDNPQGFFMLAKLMGGPRDSSMRRTYVLKAAISGVGEACREMGELEKLAAAKATIAKERVGHDTLSKEWFRLAEGEDLSGSAS